MAKRIGVLEPDDPVTSDPALCSTFVSKGVARYLVRKLLARRVGPRVIQMVRIVLSCAQDVAAAVIDGPLGTGNLIPFARAHNPFLAPQKLHYETPHAGDRSIFARHRRPLIRVSHRNLFAKQAIPA